MAEYEKIAQEVEAFYRSYIDGFNREDIDIFMQSFDLPFVVISGEQGASVCSSEADQQRFYTRMMGAIQEQGWARSGVDQLRVWPLAERLAILLADVTRYRRDGSVMAKLRAFYNVRNDGKNWKIVSLSEARAPFTGPGDLPRPAGG
jgi:ketosteroid isomerase-like protein